MLDPAGHSRKVAANRESSRAILNRLGVAYTTNNDGAHLVVVHCGTVVDFWPGTGKWIVRGTNKHRRGVFPLLRALGLKCGRAE